MEINIKAIKTGATKFKDISGTIEEITSDRKVYFTLSTGDETIDNNLSFRIQRLNNNIVVKDDHDFIYDLILEYKKPKKYIVKKLEKKNGNFQDLPITDIRFRIFRNKKTSISSGAFSFENDKYHVHQSRSGNAHFDEIRLNVKNELTDIDNINYYVSKIRLFYSLFFGTICFPTMIYYKIGDFESVYYLETQQSIRASTNHFGESERFIFTTDEKLMANIFEIWMDYFYEKREVCSVEYQALLIEMFQKKSFYTPIMHYKEIFTYLEEVAKRKNTSPCQPDDKNEKFNELEPMLLELGVPEEDVKDKISMIFDKKTRVAVVEKLEKYSYIFEIDKTKVKRIVDGMLKLRNKSFHKPFNFYVTYDFPPNYIVSQTILIREMLVIDLMFEVTGIKLDDLQEIYNIDNLNFFDKKILYSNPEEYRR